MGTILEVEGLWGVRSTLGTWEGIGASVQLQSRPHQTRNQPHSFAHTPVSFSLQMLFPFLLLVSHLTLFFPSELWSCAEYFGPLQDPLGEGGIHFTQGQLAPSGFLCSLPRCLQLLWTVGIFPSHAKWDAPRRPCKWKCSRESAYSWSPWVLLLSHKGSHFHTATTCMWARNFPFNPQLPHL